MPGRGLCNAELAAILCAEAPERIFEMDEWRVGWTREDGHLKQVTAPGHNVPRCCFVDFLNTGPAVASTLRSRVAKTKGITRISQLPITDIVIKDGRAIGAVGFDPDEGEPVTFAAKAVVLAAGGLTSIFRRNSASAQYGGRCLCVGASGRGRACRHGIRPVLSDRPSRAQACPAWTPSCGIRSATNWAGVC